MSEQNQENQRVVYTFEESQLLMGLEHIDGSLYFRLKFHMDKETKLVGAKFNLARRTLIGELKIERNRGSTKIDKPITKDTLKASIERLEKRGLVITRSVVNKGDMRLILELPKAPDYIADESVQIRNPRGTLANEASPKSIEIHESLASAHHAYVTPMNPQYQYINNINNTNVLFICDDTKKDKKKNRKKRQPKTLPLTPVPEDFQYNESHVKYAALKGLPHPETKVDEFINHYQANGMLSANWNARFRNFLIKAKEFADAKQQRAAAFSPNHQHGQAKKSFITDYTEKLAEASARTLRRIRGEIIEPCESDICKDDSDVRPSLASDAKT